MGLNNELVSVIIPVYNVEEYLDDCVNSVLQQTYTNLQIILVDDGSTDNSGIICDKYLSIDDRVQVIHSENGGSVSARKKGLSVAEGEYIGFVDSDDYIDANLFSVLVNAMSEMDCDFVHSGYYEIDGNTCIRKNVFESNTYEIDNFEESMELLKCLFLDLKSQRTMSSSIWSKLFKRELIIKCFNKIDDKQQIGEDALNLCRCILESKRITTISNCGYYYVVRNNSLSHVDNKSEFLSHISFCNYFIEIMKEYGIYEYLKNDIYDFCESILLYITKKSKAEYCRIIQYYLPDITRLINKKIILYGAGLVGQDLFSQICDSGSVRLVYWADKKFSGTDSKNGIKCIKPGDIIYAEYDFVLIALSDENLSKVVKNELIELGVDEENIVWEKPQRYF